LLREPPATLVSGIVDQELTPLRPTLTLDAVSSFLATYNLVAAAVVDDTGRLLGAITVDDVIDHLLPDDWRETVMDSIAEETADPADDAEEEAVRSEP
jgi:Mg/Co/Ni transporter MgtE